VPTEPIKECGWNLAIKNPHQLEYGGSHTTAALLAMLHESFKKSDELLGKLKKELVDA